MASAAGAHAGWQRAGDRLDEIVVGAGPGVGVGVGVGRHVICEFWGASNLQEAEHTERALQHAVDAGGATLIKTVVHQFSPHGVTAVAVLAESHLSIHTWPEMGYAAVDYFTCGSHVDTAAMLASLKSSYLPDRVETRELARGVKPGPAVPGRRRQALAG
jgi:S-adenosylmethionine decarboxylase proenzyme